MALLSVGFGAVLLEPNKRFMAASNHLSGWLVKLIRNLVYDSSEKSDSPEVHMCSARLVAQYWNERCLQCFT